MSYSINPVLQWLNVHPELAGLATFIISAAESVAIIGTIVPGSIMMTAIGALVGSGVIPFWSIMIWAILGAVAGDGVSYWLGHYFKYRVHAIWPFRTHPQILAQGENFFNKHGGKSVFIGRFVGPVRALVPLIAGMLGMRPFLFLIANITSAILWAPVYMLPGILLGAASMELPSDIAAHVIMTLLMTGLLIILCIWLIRLIYILIRNEVEIILTALWKKMAKSRLFSPITILLKHHKPDKNHGQLNLAFSIIFVSVLFYFLCRYIMWHGPQDLLVNRAFFHLSRSLRTPFWDNIMLYITFLGDKWVLFPPALALFGLFIWKKCWRTALHTAALIALTVVSISLVKNLVHCQRPWGIVGNPTDGFSFPSGHATLSFTFYSGLGVLLIHLLKGRFQRTLYFFTSLIVIAIGISRLYFGAHWFTDILGSWLLGYAIVMLVALSYNRKKDERIHPAPILLTVLVTLVLSYTIVYSQTANTLKKTYTLTEWPSLTLSIDTWWQQQYANLPLYRVNHFGVASKIFNVQWVGNLNDIESILLTNGWEISPARNWTQVLYRVSSIQSTEHLPLISPLYLDKGPVLELIKHITGNKKLIVLRFWNSNTILTNSTQPLWLGSVETAPATYNWLFKHDNNEITVTTALLFSKIPPHYDIKVIQINTVKKNKHTHQEQMILIKPTH